MIISIANQKGGVAKTTSTFNLAECLARKNKKVLMIDMDPQASLTISCGIELNDVEVSISDILCEGAKAEDAIVKSGNMYFIPSTIDLSIADQKLSGLFLREHILKNALEPILDQFDYILIDCPPSLGVLTINALTASDSVLIPTATEYLALRGINLLINTINMVKKLNSELKIIGIIPTMYDSRTLHSREILDELIKQFDNLVFEPVSKSVKVSDAVLSATNIVSTDPDHKISQAYNKIAEAIING